MNRFLNHTEDNLTDKSSKKPIQFTYPLSNDEKLHLAGPGEVHLINLEKKFNLKILSRDPGLVITSSSKRQIQGAVKVLDGMKKAVTGGGQLASYFVDAFALNSKKENSETGNPFFAYYLENPLLFDKFGKPVYPRTKGQADLIKSISQFDITLCAGPAGTGKTFLAMAMAIAYLQKKLVSKIILVRPAVESGEFLGFLPGDLREKIMPYMTPIFDALNILLANEQLVELREKEIIEIAPLAYMRGRTLNNCFILLDEAQNTTIPQMKMFLTRIGVESKTVVCGDETQKDLSRKVQSGLTHAKRILKHVNGISQVCLSEKDVVRHKLVKEIIQAYEKEVGKT